MMTDDELRAAFAAARRRDEAWTPPFERVRAGGRRPDRRGPGWRWMAAAAVAVIVVVALAIRQRATSAVADLGTLGQLRTATDFLLEVNGAEFLSTVPTIGKTEGWFPVSAFGRDGRRT